MKRPRVVVVGDLIFDLLAKVEDEVSLGTDTFTEIHASSGGSGANAAAWLARSGVETHFVARVGEDLFGRFLGSSPRTCGEPGSNPTSPVTRTGARARSSCSWAKTGSGP